MAYNNNGMAACDESENQKESGAFPYLICVCESQTQIEKKRLTRSKLPPKVKKLVANRKYLRFST
jgi:hypothetical protein